MLAGVMFTKSTRVCDGPSGSMILSGSEVAVVLAYSMIVPFVSPAICSSTFSNDLDPPWLPNIPSLVPYSYSSRSPSRAKWSAIVTIDPVVKEVEENAPQKVPVVMSNE